jgi:hypothetical protein
MLPDEIRRFKLFEVAHSDWYRLPVSGKGIRFTFSRASGQIRAIPPAIDGLSDADRHAVERFAHQFSHDLLPNQQSLYAAALRGAK